MRDIPGYSRGTAPCVGLPGPSTDNDTPHGKATRAQPALRKHSPTGKTVAGEAALGEQALIQAGVSPDNAKTVTQMAMRDLAAQGITPSTTTRTPG
jgi:hypothetical protein